jgi:hypothetical protein
VTTIADEDDGTSDPSIGTGTSLREAMASASRDGGTSVVTFDTTIFAAPRKTITLGGTQLPDIANNGSLSIPRLTPLWNSVATLRAASP